MNSLKQQIEKKAVDLGDELRDNLALDSIAKAQIIKSLRKFESYVLGLLADYVCISRKQLESARDASMKADEKLGIESLATHILVKLLDGESLT